MTTVVENFVPKYFENEYAIEDKNLVNIFVSICLKGDLETAKQMYKYYPEIIKNSAFRYFSQKITIFILKKNMKILKIKNFHKKMSK